MLALWCGSDDSTNYHVTTEHVTKGNEDFPKDRRHLVFPWSASNVHRISKKLN